MKFESKSEDTRNFLRLKPGESAIGMFRGDPFSFRTHWANNRSTVCPGSANCEICQSGNKAKFRFRVNFITKEVDTYVAKIIEQGWTVYDTMRNLNADYDLEKFTVKVTRHGSGMETTYTIIPMPNGQINPEKEKQLAQVKLNDLGHITETEKEPAESPDLEIPF